jgi:hypothetical protein
MPHAAPSARRRRAPLLAALVLATLGGCARATTGGGGATAAARPTTGEGVLAAMRARYEGKWYRTLTFVQRTIQVPPGGGAERRSTWHEAAAIPGRLRIDTDLAQGTGQLFANDSQYVVLANRVRRAVPGHNVLMVLGFDVYAQPVARSVEILRGLGFPMTPVREDTWQGRPVLVVGGRPGDTHAHQFWIDRERLVFVRLLQPFPGDTSKTFEIRFNRYRPLAGGWIAPEVEGFVGTTRTLYEEYDDVRANPRLDDALFDPRKWGTAPHWAKRP